MVWQSSRLHSMGGGNPRTQSWTKSVPASQTGTPWWGQNRQLRTSYILNPSTKRGHFRRFYPYYPQIQTYLDEKRASTPLNYEICPTASDFSSLIISPSVQDIFVTSAEHTAQRHRRKACHQAIMPTAPIQPIEADSF